MTILAYPCIGGPLAGEYATTTDFIGASRFLGGGDDGGMYAHLAKEYVAYNFGSAVGQRIRPRKAVGEFPPTMVWIHQSMLKPLQSPRER